MIIAREPDTLAPLRERPNLNAPLPQDINAWMRAAETGSYSVQIARSGYEIATREIQRQRDAYKPTVDLVSGYNINKFNGTQSSDLNPRINSGSVGVLLNVPIYTGGLIQSRVREALALQERSNFDLESARRTAANAARDAYTGVNFGLAQVSALESAEVSARTQLESTQLGYEVGVRIQLDVLNATTQLVQTQRDLKRARYDVLLAGLRLKSAAGTLGDEDIAAVNALLDPAEPITVPEIPAVNVRSPQRTSPPDANAPGYDAPPAPTTRPRGTTSTPRVSDPAAPLPPVAPGRPSHRRRRLDKRREPRQRARCRAAVRAGKFQRCFAHLLAPRAVVRNRRHRRNGLCRAGHTDRSARLDCVVRRLLEVKRVRPDDYRRSHRARLDQVLSAEIEQAAADKRDVGRRVVQRHLSHRIAEEHAGLVIRFEI